MTRRRLNSLGLAMLVAVALVAPAVALHGRLPDPIAIHWALGGAPNNAAAWWVPTAICGVIWLLVVVAVLRDDGKRSRWSVANAYGIGAVLVAAHSYGLWANLDRTTWHDARHLPLSVAALGLAIGALVGALGWAVAGPDAPADVTDIPTAGLAPGERTVWSGVAHNHWLLVVPAIAVVVMLWVSSRPPLVVIGVTSAVSLVFSSVRVVVGPNGVITQLGLFGRPRRHIALEQIRAAWAVKVSPMANGGWGWRVRPGRSAVVVRAGAGLDLELVDGRHFIVTVDDAVTAAGLVNDYVKRVRTG